MKWMDENRAMSAMRYAGEACVTAAMDGLEFNRPIPVGDTALVEAYVYDAGRTSVDVRVRASRENPTPARPSAPPTRTSSSSPSGTETDAGPRGTHRRDRGRRAPPCRSPGGLSIVLPHSCASRWTCSTDSTSASRSARETRCDSHPQSEDPKSATCRRRSGWRSHTPRRRPPFSPRRPVAWPGRREDSPRASAGRRARRWPLRGGGRPG